MEWLCTRCGLEVDDIYIDNTEEVETVGGVPICKNCKEKMEPQ